MSHNADVIRAALAAASSHVLDETGIYIEGDRKIIPERYRDNPKQYVMDLSDAINSLARIRPVTRVLPYRVWDVGVVMERWFRDEFGMSLAAMAEQATRTVSVIVNADGDRLSIPIGSFDADFLEGSMSIESVPDETYGNVTLININTPLAHKKSAEGFLDVLQERMAVESIYKGKAITYGSMPTFMDLTKIDPSRVIYTKEVETLLEDHIWSRIRYKDRLVDSSVKFGGNVLLGGRWGTGKTLAAGITAQICVAHGVTFLKGDAGTSPGDLMEMAYIYAPAVVFVEDADVFLSAYDPKDVSRMLDTFDGLDAKGRGVMAVFTTNHAERIHAGMLRPGRLRAVIEVGHLDDESRERFIRAHIDPDMIDPNLDMGPINEAMDGYVGAYIAEAIERSVVHAYSGNAGFKPDYISTQDLVRAANSLRYQYDLHENASEGVPRNKLDDALRETLVPYIVPPVQDSIVSAVGTVPGAADLHALISHNLKAYLDGASVRDDYNELEHEIQLGNPFYG